jgi:hypothetical protein
MNATRVGDGGEGRANNDASTLLNPKRGVAATPPPPACVPVKRKGKRKERGEGKDRAEFGPAHRGVARARTARPADANAADCMSRVSVSTRPMRATVSQVFWYSRGVWWCQGGLAAKCLGVPMSPSLWLELIVALRQRSTTRVRNEVRVRTAGLHATRPHHSHSQ